MIDTKIRKNFNNIILPIYKIYKQIFYSFTTNYICCYIRMVKWRGVNLFVSNENTFFMFIIRIF